MIDPRFYRLLEPTTAAELAAVGQAALTGGSPDHVVRSVASSLEAGPEDVTFVEDARAIDVGQLRAGLCFVPVGFDASGCGAVCLAESPFPRWSFAQASTRLVAQRHDFDVEGRFVSPGARIEAGVEITPGVVIGDGAFIGAGTRIGPNTTIGPGVQIGRNCMIGPNVSISCALIGDDVKLLAGVRVGESGFGVCVGPCGGMLTPHVGRVIIQNRVSIGANSCVDRGLFDDTVVGEGCQIDNLTQIAHNAVLGANVVIAAFGGVSGSVRIGDGVMMGGRSGISDHKTIGPRARLAGGSAAMTDVPAGETWGGSPAKPIRSFMREVAWLARESQKRPGGSK